MHFSPSMLWPHFIPQAICTSLWLISISKGRAYTDVLFDNVFHGKFPWEITVLNFLLLIQALGYLTYSAILINKQYPFQLKERIKNIILQPENLFSNNIQNEKNYRGKWLKHFIGLSISINLIAIILYMSFPEKEVSYIYVPVLYNFIYILIVYKSFRYSPIFMPADSSKIFRYSGSSLSKEQSHDCYLKVINLIREEKLYLQFELKLEDIANRLNLSTQYVSQAINQNENKNFFEFINSYRIEEAKKLLRERSDLTIEAIAYDSGFGSKAAFNRTFKKTTGQTPSEFIKTSLQFSSAIILLLFS
ncbi:AraC family transcriptional regulator [Sporocytophaga myxococcoides]|uniref:AraC family transcriptional regulator n=2 Tax=Sporocytophaga myxococcoides TaxID=153721 RepID=A0A098LHT5_9BACT|nr:AraC family transcriptional regulator [Sporocytophaga myxococcoides]